MALADYCTHAFPTAIRSEGRKYFREDRVTVFHSESGGRSLLAGVRGDYNVMYDVHVQTGALNRGEVALSVECDCALGDDAAPCAHMWATLLAASGGLDASTTGDVKQLPIHIQGDQACMTYMGKPPGVGDPLCRFVPIDDPLLRVSITPRAWQQALNPVAHRSRVDADRETDAAVRQPEYIEYHLWDNAASDRGVEVRFFSRRIRKDGSLGAVKPFRLSQADVVHLAPPDRTLIGLLLGSSRPVSSYYESSSYYRASGSFTGGRVYRAMFESLLPPLCATGRFVYNPVIRQPDAAITLRWDDEPSWQLHLGLAAHPGDGVRITAAWHGAGREYAVTDVRVLSRDGLGRCGDALFRFDRRAVSWLDALTNTAAIDVPPGEQHDFLDWLCRQSYLPAIDIAPELSVSVHRPALQPSVRLDSADRRKLHGEVRFIYQDVEFSSRSARSGAYHPDQQQLILRDLDAEKRARDTLLTLGFRPPSSPSQVGVDVQLPAANSLSAIRALVAAEWRVEARGARIQPGRFSSPVRVSSGIDWFDVSADVQFGDQTVPLPQLLAAIKRRDDYVVLDDGSRGLIPEHWLARFGLLAQFGKRHDGATRLRRSQATLLELFLASEPDVDVDAAYTRLKQELGRFETIAPRSPSPGFHGELRPYQRDGLGWMWFLRGIGFGGCLADDMGLGKTVQVLALIESVVDNGSHPSLIVVPRSLVFNWCQEAERFTPALRVVSYFGPQRKQRRDRGGANFAGYDLVITTYGVLRRDIRELSKIPFDCAILDEAQAIKNPRSQTAKAARLLSADHRLALTGTPIENRLSDLASIFEFLNPGILGSSRALAGLTRAGGPGRGGEELELVARSLRPYILRRTKERVASELPAKSEQILYCDLTSKERTLYNELRDHYRSELEARLSQQGDLKRSKIQVLEALLRLRQTACHPGLVDAKRRAEPSTKLTVLLDHLTEAVDAGHKALVFSQFVTLLRLVKDALDQREIKYEYLDGRTRKRQDKVERFQTDPDCSVFLISIKAGGSGLNLTAADYVFLLDPWWNPAVEAQAIDRAHRIGQTRPVVAYRLIARDTVEEKVLILQNQKRDLAEAIVTADNSVISALTADDLRMLLS